MTDVTQTRKEYDLLLPDVERNRAAVAGERAVKKETVKFLPPLASMCVSYIDTDEGTETRLSASLTAEGRASYLKYLSLAYFFGASGRTVDGLSGLVFSKPEVIELPSQIEYLKANADGKGNTLRTVAKDAVTEAFITPRSGILVDYPSVKQRVSVAQSESMNLRPKILNYKFESIINWHYEVVNNELKLTLLVLREAITVLKNRFESECEFQYRVLEIIDGAYHQSVYDDAGNEVQEQTAVLVNGKEIGEIPFFFIEVGAEDKSVINDLVDANFNHYRFFADYGAKEHASAFPVYYETGVSGNDENVIIGPGAKWSNVNSDAQFGLLQTESDGGSMRTYLLDMEQRMAALGAEMLKPRISGAESAEAKSLDQVAQNSTTADVAMTVSDAMLKALKFCALWMGSNEDVVFSLNTDYNPSGMSAQDLTALMNTWQNGGISYETFYENLVKGEIANPARKMEDELAMIERSNTGLD